MARRKATSKVRRGSGTRGGSGPAAPDPHAEMRRYPRPAVAADALVYTALEGELHALMIRRGHPPHEGRWAIPGGFVEVGDTFVDQGEDLDVAAARELEEEAGLPVGSVPLVQFRTYGTPYRDPRTRVITVVFHGFLAPRRAAGVRAGDDAADAHWVPVRRLARTRLAFDHDRVVRESLAEVRARLWDAPLVAPLLPARFTAAELRDACALVLGAPVEAGTWRRRFRQAQDDGVVRRVETADRPARYRFRRR